MIHALLFLFLAAQTPSPEALQHMQAGVEAEKRAEISVLELVAKGLSVRDGKGNLAVHARSCRRMSSKVCCDASPSGKSQSRN